MKKPTDLIMNRYMKKIFGNTLLVFLLLGSSAVQAGGFSNLDIGIKRCGMFAVVANPDDVSALYHNPAGLLNLKGNQIQVFNSLFLVGLGIKMYDSNYELYPKDHEIKPTQFWGLGPFIGYATDFGSKRWRFGTAIYFPNAYGGFMPENEPTKYHLISGYFIAGAVNITGAFKVTKQMYIGAGLNIYHIITHGKRIFNIFVDGDPDLRFNPQPNQEMGDFRLEMDGSGTAVGMNVGIILKPTENFRIGVTMTTGASTDIRGDIKATTYSGSELKTKYTNPTVLPLTLRAGISWSFQKDWEVAFEVVYWHYQVFVSNKYILDDEIVPGMKELVEPRNYTNSYQFSVGIRYKPHKRVEFMLGYERDWSPIPDSAVSIDNPTRDFHGIGVAVRWTVSRVVRLGLAYVRNWYKKVDTKDSVQHPPMNMTGQGHNNQFIVEGNFTF